MIRTTGLICVSLIVLQTAFSQQPSKLTARELSRQAATEAHQAVAVDGSSFYAIANRSIARYEKSTGKQLAKWAADEDSPIRHLNSGMILEGRLYCANSNWPKTPLKNSIEIFETETLKHLERKEFPHTKGAINWIDRHNGAWWIVFAFYGEQEVRRTQLVRYSDEWQQTGQWTFPESVIQRFLPNSNSGGAFGPDGKLYVTGHDHAELYVLDVPSNGGEMRHLATVAAPIAGQGIAWDHTTAKTLYGIVRRSHEVVSMHVPSADSGVQVIKNVAYLGEDRSEKLDLYLPSATSKEKRPAIVIVHGGGWHSGDKAAKREQNIGNNLALAGYVCASINYRLCKKTDSIAERLKEIWPGNLHDCKTAVRFLRMQADAYSIDADRIGAIGGSAGGHLVAMMAVTDPADKLDPKSPYGDFSSRIQAAVPMYGVHDVAKQAMIKGQSLSDTEIAICRQASPVTWITPNDAPMLILHGTKDALVPVEQSRILHERLQASGVASQLIVVEGAPHSFHLQPKQKDLRNEVISFFDRHLKSK